MDGGWMDGEELRDPPSKASRARVLKAVGVLGILAALGAFVVRDAGNRAPAARSTPTTESSARQAIGPDTTRMSTTTSTLEREELVAPSDIMSMDASELADRLSFVEHTVLDPGQPDDRVAEAGWIQQLLLRRLDVDPALADQVIPQLAPDVRGSLAEYLLGGRSI